MSEEADRTFAALDHGMQLALGQAWESTRAGSLGIGAAILNDGAVLATGRNRIHETDPGDDVLAGSSLAHAEMNALAKIPYRAYSSTSLYTTLQPCVQCFGAIRLSSVGKVQVLSPDPLFVGVERMENLTPFIASRWPVVEHCTVDEWSAFALVAPTMHMIGHHSHGGTWTNALPNVAALARRLDGDDGFTAMSTVTAAAQHIWSELSVCVPEVEALTAARG